MIGKRAVAVWVVVLAAVAWAEPIPEPGDAFRAFASGDWAAFLDEAGKELHQPVAGDGGRSAIDPAARNYEFAWRLALAERSTSLELVAAVLAELPPERAGLPGLLKLWREALAGDDRPLGVLAAGVPGTDYLGALAGVRAAAAKTPALRDLELRTLLMAINGPPGAVRLNSAWFEALTATTPAIRGKVLAVYTQRLGAGAAAMATQTAMRRPPASDLERDLSIALSTSLLDVIGALRAYDLAGDTARARRCWQRSALLVNVNSPDWSLLGAQTRTYGDCDTVAEKLRQQEATIGYPDRCAWRQGLFAMMYSLADRGLSDPARDRQVYDQERSRRLAAAIDAGDVEAQLALADWIQACEYQGPLNSLPPAGMSDPRAAAQWHAARMTVAMAQLDRVRQQWDTALAVADSAKSQLAAWMQLAVVSPSLAWERKGRLEAALADESVRRLTLQGLLLVGLNEGATQPGHLAALQALEPTPETDILRTLSAAVDADLPGLTERLAAMPRGRDATVAIYLLRGAADAKQYAGTPKPRVSVEVGPQMFLTSYRQIPLFVSAYAKGCVQREPTATFVWRSTAAWAVERLPTLTDARLVGTAWSATVGFGPKGHAAGDAALRQSIHEAALDWLRQPGRTAEQGRTLAAAAAGVIETAHDRGTLDLVCELAVVACKLALGDGRPPAWQAPLRAKALEGAADAKLSDEQTARVARAFTP